MATDDKRLIWAIGELAGTQPCAICGGNEWITDKPLAVPHEDNPDEPSLRAFAQICVSCAHIRYFSALVLEKLADHLESRKSGQNGH